MTKLQGLCRATSGSGIGLSVWCSERRKKREFAFFRSKWCICFLLSFFPLCYNRLFWFFSDETQTERVPSSAYLASEMSIFWIHVGDILLYTAWGLGLMGPIARALKSRTRRSMRCLQIAAESIHSSRHFMEKSNN
jgi:hypothetical protein